jgi:hypothetical protein
MTRMAEARKLTKDRPAPEAVPAWRLSEPVPPPGSPSPILKWLLAAIILIQAAWIIALIAMATAK